MKTVNHNLLLRVNWTLRSWIAVFVILISNLALAQTQDGFKGHKWGTEFSLMSKEFDLKLVVKDGNTKYYSSNVAKIGNANLQECNFIFYKGRFYFVMIKTEGLVNSRNLLAILKEAYGPGYQSNEYIENYYWFHIGDSTIGYDENSITGDASVFFRSDSIAAEEKADESQEAKKGVKDLGP